MSRRFKAKYIARKRIPLEVFSLTIPIHVWDSDVWNGIEKGLRQHRCLGRSERMIAFATTDRLGIAAIATSRKAWKAMNPRSRGWLMTHELLHLLRNRGILRGKAEKKEERLIERTQPRKTLVARILADKTVLLVNRKR